ncbi:MAG: lysophospholipid acyltransferase family protein [Nocardioidaceae bacterium]
MVVVNHVSELDPFPFAQFLYDNGRLPRFLGKAEVFTIPILGRILANAGQIPVYRKTEHAADAFSAAVAAVESGECVVIYPEGTISRDPGLWPMVGKTGAVRIALVSGCPVIPCAQWGPNEILVPYGRTPHLFPRKVMRVRADAPVDLDDLRKQTFTLADLLHGTERVMAAITGLLEQIRDEQAPVQRFDPVAAGVAEIGNPYGARVEPVPERRVGIDERMVQAEPIDIPQSAESDRVGLPPQQSPKEQSL